MIERFRDDSEYTERIEQLRNDLLSFLDRCHDLPADEQVRQGTKILEEIHAAVIAWKEAQRFGTE